MWLSESIRGDGSGSVVPVPKKEKRIGSRKDVKLYLTV
jgi:hypothetical protein